MTRALAQAVAVGRRDLALQRTYGLSLALGLVSSGLALLSHHFVSRWVGAVPAAGVPGADYFTFVSTGLALQLVVTAALAAIGGALAREAHEGTLEVGLAAGLSPGALLAGSALAPCALALVQAAVALGAGGAVSTLDLAHANAASALLVLAATLLACAPIGVLGAAAWLLVKRPGVVTTLTGFAFAFLGGVYFPVEVLPGPLAGLAELVPLTLGLRGFRAALLDDAGIRALAPTLAGLGLQAAAGLAVALPVLRWALGRARRRGDLALV